jgi:hypothetical protein
MKVMKQLFLVQTKGLLVLSRTNRETFCGPPQTKNVNIGSQIHKRIINKTEQTAPTLQPHQFSDSGRPSNDISEVKRISWHDKPERDRAGPSYASGTISSSRPGLQSVQMKVTSGKSIFRSTITGQFSHVSSRWSWRVIHWDWDGGLGFPLLECHSVLPVLSAVASWSSPWIHPDDNTISKRFNADFREKMNIIKKWELIERGHTTGLRRSSSMATAWFNRASTIPAGNSASTSKWSGSFKCS